MQDYRKLRVWQGAHKLAIETYALPPYLLKPECWPLRDQILRSAISIPSNIAEGSGRGSNPDFCRFCWNSLGSCNELESQLLLGADLKFIPGEVHARLAEEISSVRQQLTRFIQTLTQLLITGHRQPAPGDRLLAAGNRLPTTGCRLA